MTSSEFRLPPRFLMDFAGTWQIARQIQDRTGGGDMRFHGTATLTLRDTGLDYAETGTMVLAQGQALNASRRYRWQAAAEDRIDVYFEDGRFFHAFRLGQATPAAHHWCDPDDYRVSYDFSDWPGWSSRWSVNGPRKEYVMESRFRPA